MLLSGLCSSAAAAPTHKDKAITKPTVYLVGYSHLDTQWCWSYPQVIREFIPNTLHDNFKLFEKYPDYVFNWTGSNRYRFMKEYYPQDYATLKKYIAAGRWFPAGSSIEEGDVNSPSEESLVRQVLYGNEFFTKEFGIKSNEFMLPDCFGFPAQLPSVLAHCGVKGFSTQKLTWGSAVGIPFNVGRWVGPDGESVVAALNPDSYGSQIEGDLATDSYWEQRLQQDATKDGTPVDYHYYGVGDRGGSPDENSVINVEKSLHTDGPVTVKAGRADQMFLDLSAEQIAGLPQYKGDLELTQHSAGSISSEGAMKRWNRKNELLGDDAERASLIADWLGALPYDKSRITDAWLRFLPGQFHDLMAGTALPVAYNYTWNDEVLAMNEFAGVVKTGVGAATRALDTSGSGTALVVYNPLSIDRDDPVEAEVQYPGGNAPWHVQVVGPDGKAVASQVKSREANSIKIVFDAHAPSVGYAVYHVVPTNAAMPATSAMGVSGHKLWNRRYEVTIDTNGDVSQIYDKKNGKNLLTAPARLVYQHENPSQYPAWNMDWSDQQKPPRAAVTGPAAFSVVENGPERVAVRVTRESEGSIFNQTIRLASGSAGNRVEFSTRIDWKGRESALKAEFPFTVSNPEATYNWGLGTVQRGNDNPRKYEVASHEWSDLTDKSGAYGVSILDDCKYGSDKPSDDMMRLTLIYTPGVRGGYQHQAYQDWGRNEMLYALVGHKGSWQDADTQWQAMRVNQPLLAFQAPSHSGSLGRQFSFAHTNNPQVSIEAMKQSEGGHDLIVRTNELSGRDQTGVRVTFASPILSARAVDGQEETIGQAHVQGNSLLFDESAYKPMAFEVKLAPADSLRPIGATTLGLPFNGDATKSFDKTGEAYPASQWPTSLVADAIPFKLGHQGANEVVCNGQKIDLPDGRSRRLYLLMAGTQGSTAPFRLGGESVTVPVADWTGFIGQWDNRLWGGQVPELTYDWHNPLVGLQPGYIKRQPVAWYADHKRKPDGSPDIYSFCYMFRYALDVPDSARSVTLPNDPSIRIFAATVADNPNDDVTADQPLYDTLDRSDANTSREGPAVVPGSGSFSDSVKVELKPCFYFGPSEKLRYTLDGSAPTAASPVYTGPFYLSHSAKVCVTQFNQNGVPDGVTQTDLTVNDTTPPKIASASGMAGATLLQVKFSEPVDQAGASNPSAYRMSAGSVSHASLEPDGMTADLELDQPLTSGAVTISATNAVTDLSPAHNPSADQPQPINSLSPALTVDATTLDGTGNGKSVPGTLPTAGSSPWTINMFVYTDKTPGDLSLIGGFGSGRDTNAAQRYILQNQGGIYFWASNIDIASGVPFDLNRWQMVTATYDGKTVRLYKDGKLIKSDDATLSDARPVARLGPPPPWEYGHKFAGKISRFTVWDQALSPEYIQVLLKNGSGS